MCSVNSEPYDVDQNDATGFFVSEFVNPIIGTRCPKIYFVCGNQFCPMKTSQTVLLPQPPLISWGKKWSTVSDTLQMT